MEKEYVFRPVLPEEAQKVFDLVMSRVAWMDRVGIHQWNDTKYDRRYPLYYYEQKAKDGELFVLEEKGEFLCVGALFWEDVRWPEPAKARYLHHFAASVDRKGIGSLFLQEAENYAKAQGMEYMRLDSAIGNKNLENYYASRGYTECGRCEDGLYKGILRQKKL
jgi:GNAT superfamily N-acetyltransferase